ncbi:MAG: hypothetical protein O2894_07685, partial [Planctomycetota bacterium]|nr:hypothetical protein [Planctomycetota bacterium]
MSLVQGPIPFAVRGTVTLTDPAPIASVAFTIHTKPGNRSKDVHVTYTRNYLDRTAALDDTRGEATFTIFGLYKALVHESYGLPPVPSIASDAHWSRRRVIEAIEGSPHVQDEVPREELARLRPGPGRPRRH